MSYKPFVYLKRFVASKVSLVVGKVGVRVMYKVVVGKGFSVKKELIAFLTM